MSRLLMDLMPLPVDVPISWNKGWGKTRWKPMVESANQMLRIWCDKWRFKTVRLSKISLKQQKGCLTNANWPSQGHSTHDEATTLVQSGLELSYGPRVNWWITQKQMNSDPKSPEPIPYSPKISKTPRKCPISMMECHCFSSERWVVWLGDCFDVFFALALMRSTWRTRGPTWRTRLSA